MKGPLLLSLAALLLSAIGLTLVVTRSPGGAARVAASTQPAPAVSAGDDMGVHARLDALAEENRALRDRLISLEMQRGAGHRAPSTDGAVSREEFEAFRQEVLDALDRNPRATRTALAAPDPGTPPSPAELQDFRDHVAGALKDIRRQEAIAKYASIERRTEDLDTRMPRIEEWLGLTREQSNKLRSVLLAQLEREEDLIRRWEAGEEDEVLGAMKQGDREVHRAELADVLTSEQLATYLARVDRK